MYLATAELSSRSFRINICFFFGEFNCGRVCAGVINWWDHICYYGNQSSQMLLWWVEKQSDSGWGECFQGLMYVCFILRSVILLLSLRVTVDGADFYSGWASAVTRGSRCVCVCVQFQPLEKEKYSLLFFFFIRLRTHTWRSKSVLFYAFMRMYSVLDCRQAKRKIFSLFHTAPMGVRFNSQTQIHTRL